VTKVCKPSRKPTPFTHSCNQCAWDFIVLVARMKTEEEFGDEAPSTLNELIEQARKLRKDRMQKL